MSQEDLIQRLIAFYNLLPHPEGGFYAETYRSDYQSVKDNEQTLCASTGIYFLVIPATVSRLHKIKYDEMWHFYLGGPLIVVELVNGTYKETLLGSDVFSGQVVQYVVKGNTWFGCYPADGSSFSFVGCTVAPGFEFRDFILGERHQLLIDFPAAANVIHKLT
jgi:predicted cupin superfamily sugar epimerase